MAPCQIAARYSRCAAIALDEDRRDLEPGWTRAELFTPGSRQSVHLRLDPKVVEFLKAGGKAASNSWDDASCVEETGICRPSLPIDLLA
jgi:hypothetical protein